MSQPGLKSKPKSAQVHSQYAQSKPKSGTKKTDEVTKEAFDQYLKLKREQSKPYSLSSSQQIPRAQTASIKPSDSYQSNSENQHPPSNRNIKSAVNLKPQSAAPANQNDEQLPPISRKYQLPGLQMKTQSESSTGEFQPLGGESVQRSTQKPRMTKSASSKNYSMQQFSRMKQINNQKTAEPLVIHLEPEDEYYDDLRDKLWDKVYFLKNQINELNQSNSNVRAKVWNIEKENRKMIKQIENWNLNKGVIFDEENKPFVDSATSELVFQDSNFQAISLKKEIKLLMEEICEYDAEIKELKDKIRQSKEDTNSMKDQLNESLKETLISHQAYQREVNPEKHQQHIDELYADKHSISDQIRHVQEKNRVIRFMIDVQQGTFDKLQDDLKKIRSQLVEKQEEEEQLRSLIPKKQLEEINQQKGKAQKKIDPEVIPKTNYEQLNEKDELIKEKIQEFKKAHYEFQEFKENSILKKQDQMKEVQTKKQMINELEQKCFVLESRLRKRRNRTNQTKGRPNLSESIIQYGSSNNLSLSIDEIPDHIVKENNPVKKTNPFDF